MKKLRILSAAALALCVWSSAAPGHASPVAPLQPTAPTQKGQQPNPEQADEAGNSQDPEFDAVWKQFASAVRDRDEARMKAGKSGRTDTSPHPAIKFYKRFKELADKDHPDAQVWVLDHLELALADKDERVRVCREVFAELVPKHVNHDAVYRAIGGIRKVADELGEADATAMLQKIMDSSTNAQVRAQALAGMAWLKSGQGLTTDPKRLAEAREIRNQIVLAFPGTKAAKEATGYLILDVEKSFLDAERAWVSQVEKLVAEKKPISEWPKQPIHDFNREFQPLAEAGHMLAKHWVKFLYPDYVLVEKQGPEIALTWLVASLGERYQGDYAGWVKVRLDMLRLLYQQFPTSAAPWVTASVSGLIQEAPFLPYTMLEPTLKPLYDNNHDSKVRALVLFALAKSRMREDDPASVAQVRAFLQEIATQHADEDIARDAHEMLANLAAVMPGAPAPDFFVYDSARIPFRLSDYHGRVVMLVFFTFTDDECNKTIPARVELVKRLEGRPFSVIGVDIDSPDLKRFNADAAKYGLTWRTTLVFLPKDALVQSYMVRSYPTCIVIDADGIIRARNEPWDQSVKLVEKLVAETEQAAAKK